MAKVLDLKQKADITPLVEIMGPLDIGKTPVAYLVAKRLNATLITFPVLDPYSITGRALLSSLSQNSLVLEQNPNWWAHIYAANLYEHKEKIQSSLLKGPVVVTNYINSFNFWMKSLGLNISKFTNDLPQVNSSYSLYGKEPLPTTRPKFNFSNNFKFNNFRMFSMFKNTNITKIIMDDFRNDYSHAFANNLSCAITESLEKKYNLDIYNELYTIDSFVKKKL